MIDGWLEDNNMAEDDVNAAVQASVRCEETNQLNA